MKEDDEFTFARQHKVHLMNIDNHKYESHKAHDFV